MSKTSTYTLYASGSIPPWTNPFSEDVEDAATGSIYDTITATLKTPELSKAFDAMFSIPESSIRTEKTLELNKEYLDRIELLEKVLLKLNKMGQLADIKSIKEQYLLTGKLTKECMELMNQWYAKYYKELRKHPDAANVFIDIANKLNPMKGSS